LFEGTRVPHITATSGKKATESMSKKYFIVALKDTCKALDEKKLKLERVI
jgi:hypothetical protein